MTSSHQGYLNAWEWNGSALVPESGWPRPLPDMATTPLVADIDNSGDFELVFADEAGWVHVLEIQGDTTGVGGWSQYAHDARNTSDYGNESGSRQLPPPGESLSARSSGLQRVTPVPFRPPGTIEFSVVEKSQVKLGVYDTRGRLMRVLFDREAEVGHYVVHWNGKTRAGKAVPSGVYFYRLKLGDQVDTRKVVVLR